MDHDFYSKIGYIVVLGVKYIFIPVVVGVSIRLVTRKLLPPRQRKKRL